MICDTRLQNNLESTVICERIRPVKRETVVMAVDVLLIQALQVSTPFQMVYQGFLSGRTIPELGQVVLSTLMKSHLLHMLKKVAGLSFEKNTSNSHVFYVVEYFSVAEVEESHT